VARGGRYRSPTCQQEINSTPRTVAQVVFRLAEDRLRSFPFVFYFAPVRVMHVFGATVCDFGDRLADSVKDCRRNSRGEIGLVVRILLTSVFGRNRTALSEWAWLGWFQERTFCTVHTELCHFHSSYLHLLHFLSSPLTPSSFKFSLPSFDILNAFSIHHLMHANTFFAGRGT
jgi:hypothetical protein